MLRLRLYDIEQNKLKHEYSHQKAVLDCCFTDVYHCFSGDLSGQLKCYDLHAQKEIIFGSGHSDAIKCVHYCPSVNLIITGSWDRQIKLWDTRSPNCVGSYEQPDKVD